MWFGTNQDPANARKKPSFEFSVRNNDSAGYVGRDFLSPTFDRQC
jgi:hypothetical protein